MKFWQAVFFSEPEQLVEIAKIAEEVASIFQWLRLDRLTRGAKGQLIDEAENWRNAYRNAERDFKKINPALGGMNYYLAEYWDRHLKKEKNNLCPPLNEVKSKFIDKLTLNLVAILSHTTDLTTNYMTKEILPGILSAVLECYPDFANKIRVENIHKRFKNIGTSSTRPEMLRRIRFILFVGDDRFPEKLFRPHPIHRFVPHRTVKT